MTLEQEAWKTGGPPMPGRRRGGAGEGWVRLLAALILWAALSAMYWVPFHLAGPIGAAIVIAALTLVAANLASHVHRLRQRLDALESRLVELPEPPAAPGEPPPQK